jgi:6-phosphogluconate dehydrogenase
MIGLGRMGSNMTRRLAQQGVAVTAWDLVPAARAALQDSEHVTVSSTLEALVEGLPAPRALWLMLPAGAPTEQTLALLAQQLAPHDIVIDGGNAWYRDSQRRAGLLAAHGIEFIDAGVSGGVWGLQEGYGLMVGGAQAAVRHIAPVLQALHRRLIEMGALRPSGAVTTPDGPDGIEYGMMQAYAEASLCTRKSTSTSTWRR